MPADEAVAREQLAPSWTREANQVLGIRCAGRERPDDGGVERSPRRGDECNQHCPTADLEPARPDVLVRHPVAECVQYGAERRGREA